MHKLEITYAGGKTQILNMSLTEIERLILWLDNHLDKTTFKTNVIEEDKTVLIRKDLIIYINVY